MGRVFTSEELATGRLPGPNNFAAAAQFLLRAVESAEPDASYYQATTHYQAITVGALVFGSTTTETTTVRSDLDVLIAYHDSGAPRSSTLLAYREVFKNVRDIFDVPVESTIESTDDLRTGNHSIDDIFLPNLLSVPATWSTRLNPTRYTKPIQEPALATFRSYAIAKDRKFGKALTDSTDIDTKAMQRALELPVALGRKSMAVLVEHEVLELERDAAARLSKGMVVNHLASIGLPATVLQPLEKLLDIDRDYTALVEAVAARSTDTTEHERWLRAHYLPVISMAIDYNDSLSRRVVDLATETKN